ncbi:MAG: GNAT family N-acetyltransferase, partial [Bacteroidales bacterium]
MPITIRTVRSRRDLRKFIHLPSKIHSAHKNWIPPLYSDEWVFFNKKKNKSFDHCETIMLLAYRGRKLEGWIMGIIHRSYNVQKNENNARFNFLEAWDDGEVIEALINEVKAWAKRHGTDMLVGPLAFSDKDPQGYLVEGFDEPMVIASHCNFKYIVDHLNRLGFEKELDLVVYKVPVPEETPELYLKIAERARRNNPELKLIEFTTRKQLKPYIRPILGLVNDTFTSIYGFTPFSPAEMDDFANRYILVLDPHFIKVIENGEQQPVAFVIGMPDISKGIKKSRGYLYPIGFIPVLLSGRRARQLNLLLGAVRPDYQNKGLDTLLGSAMLDSARKAGKTHMDSHLEMETNVKVRAEME